MQTRSKQLCVIGLVLTMSTVIGVSSDGIVQTLCSSLKLLQDASAVAMLSCLVLHVTAVVGLRLYCQARIGNVSIQQTIGRQTRR